jgi:ABC-type amino acid transport substrate-binding protein
MPSSYADSLYDRVLKTGKIRAAYIVYFPLLMKDPNTKKFSGIGADALDLIAKRLGVKLEMTEEVPYGTMIEGLKTNRYDMIACPVWANATRARMADFSHPLYYSKICAYTKAGDKRLDSSLSGLNNGKYKIACIDGEMCAMIANADFPNARKLSLPQMADISELLISISTGKADVAFVDPLYAENFLKHNPHSIQMVASSKPLRIFPNTFMFNVGEEKFKAMFNTALDEIANSGELEKIISRYEPQPNAYLRVSRPYQ